MLKRIIKPKILIWRILGVLILLVSCKKQSNDISFNSAIEVKASQVKEKLSSEFKSYWYSGKAEISSYKLEQARYGEIRNGKAVLVYVTEDFIPNKQVKADYKNPQTIHILKLNATKNFITGIYPYSIMQSTFYPVSNNEHAIKVSTSVQEWCGHVYTQLNNKNQFEITSHSYFETEADEDFKLNKSLLENELWIKIRINPKSLPTGNLQIIPSFEFTRLRHVPIKAYTAIATLSSNVYSITYPDLNRTLTIKFNKNFPYDILEWEETFKSRFGDNTKVLTTKATKLKTIKSAYWQKNNSEDEVLRETLKLN